MPREGKGWWREILATASILARGPVACAGQVYTSELSGFGESETDASSDKVATLQSGYPLSI